MTNPLAGLLQHGYTPREAEFLHVAGLHSGHFIRHQFLRFSGAKDGAIPSRLVARLLRKRHAREYEFEPLGRGRRARRYHLFAKSFYQGIGQQDSSHRRSSSSLTLINRRIAGLDFVIDRRNEIRFFEDAEARVGYFEGLGLAEKIPVTEYPSPVIARKRARRERLTLDEEHEVIKCPFDDKFPMGVDERGWIHFTYCDEQVLSASHFLTHIKEYLPLLVALERPWRMTFITTAYEDRAAEAEGLFERFFKPTASGRPAEVERYFQLQAWYQAGDWMRFSSHQVALDRLDYQDIYETPEYKAMFERWRVNKPEPPSTAATSIPCEFDVYVPPSFPDVPERLK